MYTLAPTQNTHWVPSKIEVLTNEMTKNGIVFGVKGYLIKALRYQRTGANFAATRQERTEAYQLGDKIFRNTPKKQYGDWRASFIEGLILDRQGEKDPNTIWQ